MLIEIGTFRLVEGSNESEFLKADHRVQTEFISPLPGFVRRTTARGRSNEWLVLTFWDAASHAVTAANLAQEDPSVAAFTSFIDADSVRSSRYDTLD